MNSANWFGLCILAAMLGMIVGLWVGQLAVRETYTKYTQERTDHLYYKNLYEAALRAREPRRGIVHRATQSLRWELAKERSKNLRLMEQLKRWK